MSLLSGMTVFSMVATHSHSAGHAVQLGRLQPHPLDDAQEGAPFRRGQGALGQRLVAGHKVELDRSLVVLQGQQALPHNGIPLQKYSGIIIKRLSLLILASILS